MAKRKYRKLKIEDMQKIAESRGGKCISKEYINTSTKLEWECSKGHRWHALPPQVERGRWCLLCSRARPLSLEKMQEIAKSRGGKCLSKVYKNVNLKLKWECSKGHQWFATAHSVKKGSWCRLCSSARPLGIEEMQEIAESKGGRCLSTVYKNANTKLEWECSNGHRWYANPGSVKSGSWCYLCSNSRPLTIEEMQEIAKSKGGRCLSNNYLNAVTHLEWECELGHKWLSTPANIKKGSWCPSCNPTRSLSIENFKTIAELEGGKCLSEKYVNNFHKLLFECSKGHQWEIRGSNILEGAWCAKCAHIELRKYSLEQMKKIAKSHRGECIHKTAVLSTCKISFTCSKQHKFKAYPRAVILGMWCPICFGEKLYSIEGMQEIAKMRKGICLSKEYLGTKTKLEWQCEFKHKWKASPISIRNGGWCPTCIKKKLRK